ncbi:TrbC/VirB2 family protein [Stenotrophomonas maltophilia]|uniref:TrbC/VirB2 family protein n=1 Tax=Stenotrophomonas maltophilia TaxID=40324 RepID=UPI00313C0AB5
MKGSQGLKMKWVQVAAVMVLSLVIPAVAMAAGVEVANTRMENLAIALKAIGVTLAVISAITIGYKMQFQGVPFTEMGNKVIGMVIAASASGIAGFVMG